MRRLVLSCSILLFLFAMSSKADVSSNKKVRLVYFVPSDRHSRESQVIALRELLKEAHRFLPMKWKNMDLAERLLVLNMTIRVSQKSMKFAVSLRGVITATLKIILRSI